MSTFNDDHFNIGFGTNVETPSESMLKFFYVIVTYDIKMYSRINNFLMRLSF